MNDEPKTITGEDLAAAMTQLRRSERGGQALADFRQLLDNGGDMLDSENWEALATLIEGCRRGGCPGAYLIRCALQPKQRRAG